MCDFFGWYFLGDFSGPKNLRICVNVYGWFWLRFQKTIALHWFHSVPAGFQNSLVCFWTSLDFLVTDSSEGGHFCDLNDVTVILSQHIRASHPFYRHHLRRDRRPFDQSTNCPNLQFATDFGPVCDYSGEISFLLRYTSGFFSSRTTSNSFPITYPSSLTFVHQSPILLSPIIILVSAHSLPSLYLWSFL